tara:strand:- start:49 stop:318 length:270 start_codon:yes stop_codon:yes gene_type:complete
MDGYITLEDDFLSTALLNDISLQRLRARVATEPAVRRDFHSDRLKPKSSENFENFFCDQNAFQGKYFETETLKNQTVTDAPSIGDVNIF